MAKLTLAAPEAAGVSAVFLLPGLPSPNDSRALRFLCLSEGVVLTLPPFQDSLQPEEDGGNAAGHRFKLLRIKTSPGEALNSKQCLSYDFDTFIDSAKK